MILFIYLHIELWLDFPDYSMKTTEFIRTLIPILQENKQTEKQLLSQKLQIASIVVGFKSFEIQTRILHTFTKIAALFTFIRHQKLVLAFKRTEASLNIFLSFFSYSAQFLFSY